jgi:hypothetical protein
MRVVTLVAVIVVASTACDDSPTGPTAQPRVDARVRDTPGSSVTGTLAGNFSASIWDGSRWVSLGSPNGITVTLQASGATTTVHGEQSAPAGSYDRVRLVLQSVTANIARGSPIGQGAVN